MTNPNMLPMYYTSEEYLRNFDKIFRKCYNKEDDKNVYTQSSGTPTTSEMLTESVDTLLNNRITIEGIRPMLDSDDSRCCHGVHGSNCIICNKLGNKISVQDTIPVCAPKAAPTCNSEDKVKEYVKKRIPIKALQLLWENWDEMCIFANVPNEAVGIYPLGDYITMGLEINTLEGKMTASQGDYIIRGIKGELYSCKKEIFEESYELYTEGGN